LPLEEEQSLRRQAELAGRDVNDYLREIVREKAGVAPRKLPHAEWMRLVEELVKTVGPEVPPLSDHALSREGMYEGQH